MSGEGFHVSQMVEQSNRVVERWNHASLNIKNDEAYKSAKALAHRNGETVTMAVTIALKEPLEREQKLDSRKGRL
jgi:hypothetical protein